MDIRQIGCSTQLTPTYVGRGRGRGRGRGVLGLPIPFPNVGPFVSNVSSDEVTNPVPLVNGDNIVNMGRNTTNPPKLLDFSTSTPSLSDSTDLVGQMSTIVQQIGQQLADSIIMHLTSASPIGASNTVQRPSPAKTVATRQTNRHDESDFPMSSGARATEVQVFTQRKVKEPPFFRGDKTDTITFDDWEDAMKSYI